MAAPQALILDYGNVLSRPQRPSCVQAMAEQLGVPVATFEAAYWQHRHPYDAGLAAAEYWRRVVDTVARSSGDDRSASVIEPLIRMDVASWTEYREEVWTLARTFRAKGGRTAFLSNGVPEVMARIRAERDLEAWFDVIVVSCEVGLAKPDPRIFRICLSRLGVEPDQALFVDDRRENVEAAAQLGIQTLHFADEDEAMRLLRTWGA